LKKTCSLCRREVPSTTRHHLVPRKLHNRPRIRKTFPKSAREETIPLCRACHKQVHALLTESELARDYNTLEKLAAHPTLARFLVWIARQPPTADIPVRRRSKK
jgi:5-methylcytosine-specific restriction endonuclease McrA